MDKLEGTAALTQPIDDPNAKPVEMPSDDENDWLLPALIIFGGAADFFFYKKRAGNASATDK